MSTGDELVSAAIRSLMAIGNHLTDLEKRLKELEAEKEEAKPKEKILDDEKYPVLGGKNV